MMATWQEHIENAVSKTVNLPSSSTVEDVASIYQYAYTMGCKGITVYRDGCRNTQPIKLNCKEGQCILE